MSSDNYYTIRQNPEDGLWYLYHGFSSNLEDGFPATSVRSAGFELEEDALEFYREQPQGFMESYYSEYGLLLEPDDSELQELRIGNFKRWPEDLDEDWAAPYREETYRLAPELRR